MTDTVRLPREPTAEMLDADVPVRAMEPLELEELRQGKPLRAIRRSIWRAMIAAAKWVTDTDVSREATDEMVEEAAAAILSAEENSDAFDLEWGRRAIASGKNDVHMGDCTKQCGTCIRCVYEDYTRIARAAISAALAAAPQAADPRDVETTGLSWNGFNVVGDRKSIDEVLRQENENERLSKAAIMQKASAEAAGSLLLDVQRDCIAERQRVNTLTRERDALLDDCRTLLTTIFKHVDPDALPNYGEVLAISSRVPPLTATQPGGTETPDA